VAGSDLSQSECLRRVQAARTAVMRQNGGDDVNFNFFKRADAAEALCRTGRTGEAASVVAAIKSDLRGLWKERFDFN